MPAMTIDMLPTLAGLAGATISQERIIDGRDLWPVLSGRKNAAAPHDALYFYWGQELHAVRRGKWKLHLPHPYQSLDAAGSDGLPGKYVRRDIELSLYDLDADPREARNVAAGNPAVVAELMTYVERAREDLGDTLVKRTGKNVRPAGKI
jgi:arylsulfatase A